MSTKLQISLYITVAGVLFHETVESAHIGRWCSETVTR